MCLDIHWTAYVTALSVPVIAAFGGLIAYRQWKTARDKLKLDIFDRRMAVYQAATSELTRALGGWEDMGKADSIPDKLKLQEAKWLMSKEVAAYLEKPFQTSLEELAEFSVVLEGHDPSSATYDWDGHDARLAERTKMYERILAKLDELFSPFLMLKH